SPANRVQDLFVYWPETPAWSPDPQDMPFVGLSGWDAKGLETKVTVQGGELDLLGINADANARTKSATKGYTANMTIPWSALRGRILKDEPAADGTEKRTAIAGSRFRGNFYRIEAPGPARPKSYMAWSPVHY